MSRLSVLFAAFQSRHRSNGGVESATRIFEALADRFDWSLLTTRDTPATRRWQDKGARIFRARFADDGPSWLRKLQGLRWSLTFIRAILAVRPGLVHLNDIQSYRAYSLVPRSIRPPMVFTLRDTRADDDPYGPVWHRLVGDAEAIVVLSQDMGERLCAQLPAARSKLTAIRSIVDLEAFRPREEAERHALRKKLGIADGEFAIGCIGAIRDKKGQRDFIERAMPTIASRMPAAHVHFIGDCDRQDAYVRETVSTARNLGLEDRVTFHGHRDDIIDWYGALDIVVIAARFEGLARGMIEAMATGLPVVSFSVCSARETLEESGGGLVVEIGDYAGLADAIAEYCEKGARRDASQRGRRYAEKHFAATVIARCYADFYERFEVREHAP